MGLLGFENLASDRTLPGLENLSCGLEAFHIDLKLEGDKKAPSPSQLAFMRNNLDGAIRHHKMRVKYKKTWKIIDDDGHRFYVIGAVGSVG